MKGINPLFWWISVLGFGFIPIYVLNTSGYITLSAILSTALGATGIFLAAATLGNEANVHYFFIALAYSLFLNSLSSNRLILLQIGIILTALGTLFYIDFDIGFSIPIDPRDLALQRAYVLITNLLLVTLLSYNFRTHHDDILKKVERYFKEREKLRGVSKSQLKSITENRHLLQAIYDNSSAGIILEDPVNSTIVDLNERAEQIFRRFKSQLIGSNAMSLLSGLKPEQLSEILHSLQKKIRWTGDTVVQDAKGSLKWINLSLLHFTSTGREYRLWSIQDIDHIKAAQEALEEKNAQLNELNEDLDAFVYSVAHDMRGPLATLQSLIQMTLEDNPGMSQEQFLMKQELIRRMERYIDDVVNFSKNKRVDIEKTEVNIHQLVQDIRAELKHYKDAQRIELITEIPETCIVYSDEYRLRIILQNLIANAINYADLEKEQPFIRVSCEQAGDAYKIVVSDNGLGIDDSVKERVFQMFFRGSSKSTGSGLGLFLVKESVKKLKGEIHLESQKNIGSEFILILPN